VRAVTLLVRGGLRRRWLSTVIVTVIVAIASGAVLTLVAGARRTAHEPASFTKYVGGDADAEVQQSFGAPLTDRVRSLPDIASLRAITFLFAASDTDAAQRASNTLLFAGTPLASRIVAGRPADLTKPFEFVADTSFVARTHTHVGDRFHFVTWSRAQAARGLGFQGKPGGPAFTGTLVGVVANAGHLQDGYSTLVFPATLLHEDVGTVATIMTINLRRGVTRTELRSQLDGLPGGSTLIVDPAPVVAPETRSAVNAQALGIWILALVAGATVLIALGQLMSRHARLPEVERNSLSALGFTRMQLVAESTALATVPALGGVALGATIAVAASGIFPLAFTRELEANPGIRVDLPALGLGGLVLLLGLLAWVAATAILFGSDTLRREQARSSATGARRAPTATASIGSRFALTTRGRSSVGTIATLAIVVTGIVGSIAFAASLDRLVTHRERFGSNYDFQIGDNSDLSAKVLRTLAGDPDIAGMSIVTGDHARAGGTTVDIVGIDTVEGEVTPHVLSGRLPSAPDEVALGRITARQLHLHRGDTLQLVRDDGQGHVAHATYRVVGFAVMPTIAGNDGLGKGAVMTAPAFTKVAPNPSSTMAAIDLRPGAPANTQARLAHQLKEDDNSGVEDAPASIVNVTRVRRVPVFLAGLLAALLLLAMFHAIVTSIRERRHDLAVLSALGADRSWISRAVHWQATVLTLLPLVVGVPLGLVAGSKIFSAFTDRLGAVPDPALPFALVALLTVALVVAANIVAVLPTRRARRLSTAALLRVD
jgi:ABC-type lipoprotein release transport system permease subunit